ncbi:hypothetical protein KC325_g8740 [Hortaea werneckii]|nr:hypothetical protein KC325_g8740 [Hortaea werneckii]
MAKNSRSTSDKMGDWIRNILSCCDKTEEDERPRSLQISGPTNFRREDISIAGLDPEQRPKDVGAPATLALVAELPLRRPEQQDQSAVVRRLYPTASRTSDHKQPRGGSRSDGNDNDDDKNISPLATPHLGLLVPGSDDRHRSSPRG